MSQASYAFAGGKSINDFWERTYLGISDDDYLEDLEEAYSELSGVFAELNNSSASAFIRTNGNFSRKHNWGHLNSRLPREIGNGLTHGQ